MDFPSPAATYLVNGLATTPALFREILSGMTSEDERWDRRVDPDRFTLREMAAHLADWEPIWLDRVERTLAEDEPFLPSVDEGALAVGRAHESLDPVESIERFADARPQLVGLLRGLSEPQWGRCANREFVGRVTIQMLATMAMGHDLYHVRQALEFRDA